MLFKGIILKQKARDKYVKTIPYYAANQKQKRTW